MELCALAWSVPAVVHSDSSRDQRWFAQHQCKGDVRGNCYPEAGSLNQPGRKEGREK